MTTPRFDFAIYTNELKRSAANAERLGEKTIPLLPVEVRAIVEELEHVRALRAELRQILAVDGRLIVQEWRATVEECPRLAAILREPCP